MITLTCPRCDGTGRYSYHAYHGTRCFRCGGAGQVQITPAQYAAQQRRRSAAAERRELEREAQQARAAIGAQVTAALIARYAGTPEFERRTAHAPEAPALRAEVALLLYGRETGRRWGWVGELAADVL